ncbi:glycerol-3-phosphate acyltransferase 3-like [Patiria miniata]|uniref:Phospholipid/glycerol acyltransferase domain-containing protein n=1 Tax=Patiria miniata TaxID=46514 RepID=A0A913Z1H8_PATMI|nr:glycerol-3-phosphate acyltransferase 3-like [Patiria miniata]
MEQLLLVILGVTLTPFMFLVLLIVVPGCFGLSLGLRHLYINFLLRMFELGNKISQTPTAKETHFDFGDEEENDDEVEKSDDEKTVVPNVNSANELIHKESTKHLAHGIKQRVTNGKLNWSPEEFQLSDVCYFTKKGVEAIIDDEVTKRFTAEELPSWNLLTRTSMRYQYLNIRLTLLWMAGFVFRYFLLLPVRLAVTIICMLYLLVSSAFLGYLPDSRLKQIVNKYSSLTLHRMFCRCFSAIITFHNKENRAKGGICVANHTSPIDIAILSFDNVYAFIGQLHSGFMGMVQRAMSRTGTDHIWFERSEMRDRKKVTERLREHVNDPNKLPILIFPEGTCINNTSVMQFKKGSFEVGGTIWPVAIKYNSNFGDPFWNSSKYSMVRYLLMMLTSWAIVCDVWYLPPMVRGEDEESIDFANRVKAAIAKQGGLLDLTWDGQLKRTRVKSIYKAKEQEEYSKMIKTD